MPHWFGSSGIRGHYRDISPSFAMKLGIAVAKTFEKSKMTYIGSDVRLTSNVLKSSFNSGFSYASRSICDIDLCPTPIISYLSSVNKTLGVMVTASHNPPSNNGFKFFLNGAECGRDFEEKVEKKINNLLEKDRIVQNWKEVGRVDHIKSDEYKWDYINYLLRNVSITDSNIKIILDCANNVPNLISPVVLEKLGFDQIITINSDLDGFFSGRPSEPTSENLGILKARVIEESANIGIAHDGDGDRFAIIDEEGNMIKSTTMINFFLDHLDYSNPNRKKVILTSDCTNQAFLIAEKNNANIITSRIGRNREYVNDKEVLFLAEPNKVIFPELGKWIDGIFPVLKFLEIVGSKKPSEILAPYDKRKILRKAFRIANEDNSSVNEIIQSLPDRWSNKIRCISTFDGLKLNLKDESSILIRISGTEPKIKFYIESDTEKGNHDILKQLKKEFKLKTIGKDC